jgi:hypothetical protein
MPQSFDTIVRPMLFAVAMVVFIGGGAAWVLVALITSSHGYCTDQGWLDGAQLLLALAGAATGGAGAAAAYHRRGRQLGWFTAATLVLFGLWALDVFVGCGP